MSLTLQLNKIPIELVDEPGSLASCINHLRTSREIAVDLEFDNNRHAYGFHLCVIQVATASKCFVIDGGTSLDLKPLFAVMEDPGITKLLHCPGEDLRLLHSLGCKPKNMVDTDITAKLLDYEIASLAMMLDLKLGIQTDKKLQKSNWLLRPLSGDQILYAAHDVIHLFALRDVLLKEADMKGIAELVADEFSQLDVFVYNPSRPENLIQPADKFKMGPWHQYVLNELLKFREDLARERNRPSYQIMPYELAREIALGHILPEHWLDQKGLFRGIKTPEFQVVLTRKLNNIFQDADNQGLPMKEERTPLTLEEKRERARLRDEMEAFRLEKFVPVQQELAVRYGKFAARHILSTGTVNDILKGHRTLDSIGGPVKIQLIRSIADGLGIDLSSY